MLAKQSRASGPLWQRTTDVLRQRIDDGSWAVGAQLPSERDLVDDLGVSRITLRRALGELAGAGVLRSETGRGWFVEDPGAPSDAPNILQSFTERGAEQGWNVSSLVERQLVRASTFDEARRFELPPGAPLLDLERVRFIDGREVSLDRSLVPVQFLEDPGTIDFTSASLYAELARQGYAPRRATSTVSAIVADDDLAQPLGCGAGAPILRVEQSTRDRRGVLVEAAITDYRGDRYRFVSEREA